MKICGIIAEYNPFHKGHLYQIEKIRDLGFTHIIAVMSGNVVQRGDFAICDKWQRTMTAMNCGVDMIIELPCVYSLSSAEGFARGAISALNSLNAVDSLCFGSESGDIGTLMRLAEISQSISNSNELKEILQSGYSYPKAVYMVIRKHAPSELSDILLNPNDTLAIEYIKAINFFKSDIKPLAIKRNYVDHNSTLTCGEFASASTIRGMMKNNIDYSLFIPKGEKYSNFSDIKKAESAILYKLRTMTKNDFEELPDVSQGLENRLYKAARSACSVSEFIEDVKTRRYTFAKIRRLILYAVIGIKKSDFQTSLPYLRILGMSENGKEILKTFGKKISLPIDTKLKSLALHSKSADRFAKLEAQLTDIFFLTTEKNLPCGYDYTNPPIII